MAVLDGQRAVVVGGGSGIGVDGGHTLRAFPDYRRYGEVPDQFRVAREEP